MRRLRQLHKIQELFYELKIRDAADKSVTTIPPETMMSQVRQILRSEKITAAPVITDGRLLGIISVEDYINWLQTGGTDVPVSERMSLDLISLYDDEPLVDAIKNFEKYRYYEFPVLERATNELMGIITKFDIIVCLLKALDIDYYTKEITQYLGMNFFDEVVSDSTRLHFSYQVPDKEIKRGARLPAN